MKNKNIVKNQNRLQRYINLKNTIGDKNESEIINSNSLIEIETNSMEKTTKDNGNSSTNNKRKLKISKVELDKILQKINLFNNKSFVEMIVLKEEYTKIYNEILMDYTNLSQYKEIVEFKNYFSNINQIKHIIHIEAEVKENDSINQFFHDLRNRGYLNYVERQKIIKKYESLYDLVSKLDNGNDFLKEKIFKDFKDLKRFIRTYTDLKNYTNLSDDKPNYIKNLNLEILDEQIIQDENFFKGITDINKKRAIVIDEKNVRVNAGAGTGKTFTIQKKAEYLIEKKKVSSPEKILCLSYTVKGAEDLDEKVNQNIKNGEIEVCTFHEFCRRVAYDCGHRKTTDRTILAKVMSNYFKNMDDDKKLNKLIEYFGYYVNSPVDDKTYDTYEELLTYETGRNLKTLKNKFYESGLPTLTMQGEIVKSIGELIIANYLFMHEIEYVYERRHKSDLLDIIQKQFLYSGNYFSLPNLEVMIKGINDFIEEQKPWYFYRPDFYLPEKKVYLEHFGIGHGDNEKWLGKDYLDQMDRKREYHKLHGTKLLETYYCYLQDGVLIEKLEELLIENGFTIGQMEHQDIIDILENIHKIDDFENFNKLIENFINIFEAKNSPKSLLNKFKKENKLERNGYKRKRQELFLDIVSDIYEEYYKLNNGEEIDNNREVSLALELIQTGKYSKSYDYILVDEYQDINPIRSLLLKSLQKITNAKLFVVGDDWQSIYRFNGSEVKLFLDFDNDFPNSELIKLKENRRNYDKINDVALDFITKNPNQEIKNLKSINEHPFDYHPIKIINYAPKPEEKKVLQLYSIINQIIKDNSYKEKTKILLLGRNNKDIDEFTGNTLFRIDNLKDRVKIICLENPKLDITFMSIHKSKGLEYDEVIVLNFIDYFSGFPNKIEDDSILLFLKEKENYKYAEERRLLYVALTRTLNNVYLLSPKYDRSVFIDDLINDYNIKPFELEVDERIEKNFSKIEKTEEQIDEINKMLNKASKYHSLKRYDKAIEIFDKYYKTSPEHFKYIHKEDYAWSIYNAHVKKFRNENDFFNSVELIMELVEQRNSRSKDLSCAYTSSVLAMIKYLRKHNLYDQILPWFSKLNPNLLNGDPFKKFGKLNKSKKELYYDYLSNAYFKNREYEKCIEVSKFALDTLEYIVDDSWNHRRIGISLKNLNRFHEAIDYLKYAADVFHKWYIYKDIVECYGNLKKYPDAFRYASPIVLSGDISHDSKKEIYLVLYNIFSNFNQEMAIKHAQFYYLLKRGSGIPYNIRKLNINASEIDINQLESEIVELWKNYEKSQKKPIKSL